MTAPAHTELREAIDQTLAAHYDLSGVERCACGVGYQSRTHACGERDPYRQHLADALIAGPLAPILAEVEQLRDMCKAWKHENGIIADQRDALRVSVAAVQAMADKWINDDSEPLTAEGVDRQAANHGCGLRIRAALDDPDTVLRGVRAEALREAAEQFRQAERDGYLFLNGSAERMPWEVVAQSLDERADRIARAGGEG